jgi:hypothetical protein
MKYYKKKVISTWINESEKWAWKIHGEIRIQAPENNFLRGTKICTSPDNMSSENT